MNSSPAHSRRRFGLMSGIVSGACYGGMVFLIHNTAGGAPASEITFLRAICAVVVLLPFIARHGSLWFDRSSVLLWTCLLYTSLAKRLRLLRDPQLAQLLEDEVWSRMNLLAPESTICLAAADRLRGHVNGQHKPNESDGGI